MRTAYPERSAAESKDIPRLACGPSTKLRAVLSLSKDGSLGISRAKETLRRTKTYGALLSPGDVAPGVR